jgi:Ca2+/Na+ antiporter
MEAQLWNRDLIFYIFTLCVLLVFGFLGEITVVGAVSFFGIYAVYLAVVIYVEYDDPAKLQTERRGTRARPSCSERRAP